MKHILSGALICLLSLLSFNVISAETPPAISLSFRTGAGANEGQGVAVGSNGTIYSTGQYSGTGTFGSTTLTNGGAQDYYLSAHSPDGTPLWAVRAGSTLSDFGSDVALDKNGDVVVVGVAGRTTPGDTVDFNNVTNVAGFGLQDAFIAKYNSSRTLLWVRFAGGTGNDQAYDVAVDSANNYVISGRVNGLANFDGTIIGTSSQVHSFIAKYDSEGHVLWVQDGGQMDSSATTGVAVDYSNNTYLSGVSTSSSAPFVAKYNSAGSLQWKKVATGGTTSFNENSAVDVDATGNVYVAGRFGTTSITFGTTSDVTLSNPSGLTLGYLVKYDSAGTAQWAAVTGARAFDVAIGVDGGVYVVGFTSGFGNGNVTVGSQTVPNSGSLDPFVAKFTTAGALVWVQYSGTSGSDTGRAITLSSDSIYITGEGVSDLFDNFPGGAYVAKLSLPPTVPTLSISIVGSELVISWEPDFTGFQIETTTDLSIPFSATALSFAPVGGQANTYSLAKPGNNLFIRLSKPAS